MSAGPGRDGAGARGTPGGRGVRLACIALGCALHLAAPAAARAQVRGRVVDTEGRPLPGVLVELWEAGRRLGGDGTDAQGHFRFAATPSGPGAVLARGIGLDPLRRVLRPADSVVTLVMTAHAPTLREVTVETRAAACPQRNDRRAVAMWRRMAAHYDIALSAYGVQTDAQLFVGLVHPDSVGVIDTTLLQGRFLLASYSELAFETRYRTADTYYGVKQGAVPWGRFGRWQYPLLESARAWHFVDTLFTYLNRLQLEETPEGDTVIAFCSRLGGRPYIRGRLRIAPDSTLASAEWEYFTPAPREEAGGQVFFAPADSGATGQPLLPAAGLFWRKTRRLVYEEWMEYREWRRCEAPGRCWEPVPLR